MTKTVDDVRAAIELAISTEMAKLPSYPVSYLNTSFSPPNNTPWVEVVILFGDSGYATLLSPGPGFDRISGAVSINVYTPAGTGAGSNNVIAERLKRLFNRAKFAGITFDPVSGPSRASASNKESGGVSASTSLAAAYYQTQMTVTFDAFVD
jgi:hypothetical protein